MMIGVRGGSMKMQENVNVNVNVEFKMTLYEQVRYSIKNQPETNVRQ